MLNSRWVIVAVIFIVLVFFVLPALLGDSIDDLRAFYEDGGKMTADAAARMGYLYRLNVFLDLASKVVAGLSLLGLLYQFYREKNMKEAEFVLNINDKFITNPDIKRIYALLERSKEEGQEENPFKTEDVLDVANYLSFFETFYSLIHRGVIGFKAIDQLAYRFFLATNNKFVQEMLICKPGKEKAWKDLYALHHEWNEYRKGDVWQGDYELSTAKEYDEIVKCAA